MAKKYKLMKNGEVIYPCSTTDAIVNPNTKKTVTEEIESINNSLENSSLHIKLYLSKLGIGYEDMTSGQYYDVNGNIQSSSSFMTCKIDMELFRGGIIHFKALQNSTSALCSWVKSDGSIVNLRIYDAEQDVIVPDDAKELLVTNNNVKEDSLITYNGIIDNKLQELDYKSNGFYFSNDDLIDGYYNSKGTLNNSKSFRCLKIDVSSLKGKTLNVNLLTNGAAPCSWIKDDLSIENFQVTSEQDVTIPDDAIYLLVNNAQTNLGGYVQYQTEVQKNIDSLMNQESDSDTGQFTFYGEDAFHVGYFDVSGVEHSSVSFVCTKIDVSKYVGRNVYLRLYTNTKAPCSWIKSDGSVENFVPTGRMIQTIPDDAVYLACSHNTPNIESGYYVFIAPNTISQYTKGFFGLTNYVGKKLTTYGDSITDFGGWQDIIVNTLGFSSHTNCGVAGSTVCLSSVTNMSLCDDARIAELPTDTDVLLIMGGTNDFSGSKEIGEQTYDNEDGDTFFGALNIVAKKAITQCPNARILFMSIYAGKYTSIDGWSEDIMVNKAGNTTYDYRDAIKKCAYMHGFPFVDITGEMGANRYNADKYFAEDGAYSHPNDYGKEEMAKIIISRLLSL